MANEPSPLGRGDEAASRGKLRASHDDRNGVVELLRVSAGDGRLTVEELDERVAAALTARTYGELAPLVADLPVGPGRAVAATVSAPKDVLHIYRRSGHAKRDGHWIVPRRIGVRMSSGHVTLDFTRAIFQHPTLLINVEMRDGHLTLVTKPGVMVDIYETDVRYSRVKVREPRGPEVPVILRIDVIGQAGKGKISVRPPRWTFWPWPRRRPWSQALPAGLA